MNEIQLIYAKNFVVGKLDRLGLELEFFIHVANLAYHKEVDVLWAVERSAWQRLEAGYHGPSGHNREIWRAHARFGMGSETSLPGGIRFALRYRVLGAEYWDNNNSRNYSIETGSGILVRESIPVQNIEFNPSLLPVQKIYPVAVAVRRSVDPKAVHVHWTTDNWKTRHETPCFRRRAYRHQAGLSKAESSSRHGWRIWAAQLDIECGYRLEYAICCDTSEGRLWDNNLGANYHAHRERLKILTLNLHCYQEQDQDEKFSRIAGAISDLSIDIVCLQEVGENWGRGKGDRKSNAARIIKDRLKKSHGLSYHLFTDWAHIGFGKYREGVAILSRHRFLKKESRYVSGSRDIHDIHARKAVMVRIHVPYMGLVNVYAVHLSWWDGGFPDQFENLVKWADGEDRKGVAATFLCGDFNIEAWSRGYALVVGSGEYEDQFLEASSPELFHRIFRQPSQGWENGLVDDHRIDYIFKRKDGTLQVASAKTLFTDHDYGRVSDHFGYYMEFEPTGMTRDGIRREICISR
jgi:maltose 6'-phosphate phosphatase